MFYLVPGVLSQLASGAWFGGAAGMVLHYIVTLADLALTIWGLIEIGCLRGTAGPNTYGPEPAVAAKAAKLNRSPASSNGADD